MIQPSYIPSTNGLQSYVDASPSYELSPIGIASMQDQAQKLAEMGRNGDIYVIHAAQGETVIPMEVLEANPQIKALLFNQMTEMGLDPQRYVVGDQLNSLNPVTGMPEFFFSSIFKGIKKAVKSVVKVVKKLAPVILPIAASVFGIPFLPAAFFGPASFGAAALSSGIGTLIGGGNLKDAFKSALIAGGTAGIFGAFKGISPPSWGLGGTGTLEGAGKGFMKALYNPAAQTPGQVLRGIGDYVSQLGEKSVDPGGAPIFSSEAGSDLRSLTPNIDAAGNPIDPTKVATGPSASVSPGTGINRMTRLSQGLPAELPGEPVSGMPWLDQKLPATLNILDRTGDYLFRGGKSTSEIAQNVADAEATYIAKMKSLGIAPSEAGLKEAAASAQPNMLVKYGPTAGLGFLAAQGLGAFDVAAEEEIGPEDAPFGLQVSQPIDVAAAEEAEIDVTTPNVVAGVYQPPAPVQVSNYEDFLLPNQFAARGGSINYPERDLLVEGPGTEKSDDIPAMLSDGEFVINSKAVRGADPSGKGNRYAGAQNLYNLMRNFEMRA